MISFLEHKWETPDVEDILELYLRSKMMMSNIHLTDNEYKTVCYFYTTGDCDKESTIKVVDLNYFKSKQTVENCKSKLKRYDILTKNNKFNYKIIPKMGDTGALLQIKVMFTPKENETSN